MLITFSTEHNQKESPFLRLPGELRNKIYCFYLNTATFDVKTYYVGDIGLSNWSKYLAVTRREMNLALVCRQFYQESQPFLKEYRILKIITAQNFHRFRKVVKILSTHHNLVAVREVEIVKKTALDMARFYEKYVIGGDSFLWFSSKPCYLFSKIFQNNRLLPALEVVVWPGTATRVPLEKREAAIRLVFNKSDIQVVSG